MALICPVCSTENREGANFCRSCGDKLSAAAAPSRIPPPAPGPTSPAEREWATTAPAQLRAPTIPAPLEDFGDSSHVRSFFGNSPMPNPGERTVILAPGQPPLPPMPPSPRRERSERKRSRTKVPKRPPEPPEPALKPRGLALWLGLLTVAVVMIVAGWYGYGTRSKTAEQAESPPPPPLVAPAPPAAPPVVVEPPPAALETPAAEPPVIEEAAPVLAPAPKPSAKPRKAAAPTPQAAAPEAPAAAAAPAAPPPAAAAPAEPMAMCGDRNFIARAQCMAAQCLKPEYKPHAQCEAVRRQQRLEEEKRNPTLIN